MKKRTFAASLLAVAAFGTVSFAQAQDTFPSRSISIVVPFGPGAGSDVGARLLAQKLSEALHQSVVVENKPGASGAIAAEYVAKAKPDGYTLLIGTNSTHGANPALLKEIHYDPIKDFEPVNRVAIFTSVIAANLDAPFKTFKEMMAYGKTHELTLATGNASGIVMSEALARQAGWKPLLRVQFKSNPQAMTEVLAGRVQFMFTDLASALGQLKAGSVRPLALSTKERSALLPDVPTIAESGLPDYDLSGWIALFAPAGTPKPVIERLNAQVTKAMQAPEVRAKFLQIGAEPAPMPLDDFKAWARNEVPKWTRLVKEAGIQAQ